MIDERTEELAALYALDLLEPAEAQAFALRLESDTELRQAVDDFRETGAAIAHGAPPSQPSADLEARIFAEIHAGKVIAFPRPVAWLPWALAACLAVVCGLTLFHDSHLQQEFARLQQQDEFAHLQVATLGSKLSGAPEAKAVVLWDQQKQRGVVKLDQVPAPDAGHDYQLWIIDPHYQQPISAGVIPVGDKGLAPAFFTADQPISSAQKFAISVEKKGGSTAPAGPIVFISE